MTRYKTMRSGAWFAPKLAERWKCCDCGLVHWMEFKLASTANGQWRLVVRATVDKRQTAQMRKERKGRKK